MSRRRCSCTRNSATRPSKALKSGARRSAACSGLTIEITEDSLVPGPTEVRRSRVIERRAASSAFDFAPRRFRARATRRWGTSRKLPATEIKIDKRFNRHDRQRTVTDREIVKTVGRASREALGMRIVAEGIDKRRTRFRVRDRARMRDGRQGFFIGRPELRGDLVARVDRSATSLRASSVKPEGPWTPWAGAGRCN